MTCKLRIVPQSIKAKLRVFLTNRSRGLDRDTEKGGKL